ncbi:LysR family transcriptional regulator [Spiribacter halobius]|uniref:LysR family transcriptional regulator n=1 Tax=Sediminicurvatus halobius TaxID=2182432 RepID=A0A2U2MXR8_9GAMM|nr:LysR family transcriptional regulator [Spiribacter halobius]PWG61572.1 LysR family transcriptional regulator [Spiribacter halobius]UEX77140.1 LysR family transcriptional regulator [Spiribacter halobius]
MLEDLRALVLFAKTVETGSFRKAAEAFGLSPSVVSHHIAQLEQRRGTALLYRSPRKLALTASGRRVFGEASALARSAESIARLFAEDAKEVAGEISVSFPAALLRGPLMRRITAFAHDHPDVSITLIATDRRTDIVGQGVDMALRVGTMPDSALKAVSVGQVERTLVCAPALLHRYGRPAEPSELAAWPWIRLAMLPPARDLIGPHGERARIQFTSRIQVDSVDAMYQLTRAGLGISSPPDYLVAEDLVTGDLVPLLPQWSVTAMPVYAVWPPNTPPRSVTRRLVDYLREPIESD